MGRIKQQGCCECATPNCLVRVLKALKQRCGFPTFYSTTGAVCKLRFLGKTMDYTWVNNAGIDFDYHADLDIIERKTGKLAYTETSSLNLTDSRTQAISRINSTFNTWRTSASGTYTSGTVVTTIDWTFNGDDMIAAYFHQDTNAGDLIEEWTVTLDTEHTDTMLKADVDDLLTTQVISGVLTGLDAVADNTLVEVYWNENNINNSIGAIAVSPPTLDGYTTTADPALTINVFGPGTWFDFAGQWWQHAGGSHSNGENIFIDPGFSFFDCTFDADTSMHGRGGTGVSWEYEHLTHVRFNVGTQICAKFTTTDTDTSTETACQIFTPVAGHVDVQQPHPEAISNNNIRRSSAWEFTAPGYLTAGDCPCTNAP